MSKSSLDLSGAWSFAYTTKALPESPITSSADLATNQLSALPCTVPGNFELDLQAHGKIEDPFFGTNTFALRAYETAHLWYFRSFRAARRAGAMAWLVFEGIDCFAEIYIDGKKIGDADNMLVEHAFEIESCIGEKESEHELFVHIRPAVEEARKYPYPPGIACGNMEALYVRKAAHMYGWDILPRAVSAGLWRPVTLQYRPIEGIETTYLQTKKLAEDHSRAHLRLRYRLRLGDFTRARYEIALTGACGKSAFAVTQAVRFAAGSIEIELENPLLWWPRERGAASLYDVRITLRRDGEIVDEAAFTFGVRTAELLHTSVTDLQGNGEFCFRINGERVFVKGTNWVAADAFHSRDIDRIPKMLDLAEECGCNMIRCWGGNVYENDLFYALCDQKGIMVWQDFSMACGAYPQDVDFQARLAREAMLVVRRLRHHACIVLWAGDNECDEQVSEWSGGKPSDNVLTRRVLPDVLRAEDPCRPYLPSSPYLDDAAWEAGAQFAPEAHLWGPRNYFKSDYYRLSLAHFVSEFGYHACPAPESVRKFISRDRVWPYTDNEEWNLHSTSPLPPPYLSSRRVELMEKQVRELFGAVPTTLEEYAFASQAVQAEALKFLIDHFRAGKWRRTGLLWWNLIDGWPQFSDAIVDYYFVKKLAFGFVARAQEPVTLIFREPQDWQLELVASNDLRRDMPLAYRVHDVGQDRLVAEGEVMARADAVTSILHVPFSAGECGMYRMEGTCEGKAFASHYLFGNPPFDLSLYREWLTKAGLL